MLYSRLGFSSGDVCAAVARGIVHDAAVNRLAIKGLPEISCTSNADGFQILLRSGEHRQLFNLTEAEATRMIETMRTSEQHDQALFDRIQNAVAELEGDRSR